MADDGKEFPDEFSPVPTPLTGSERILVEKGTATIDDVKAFARTNLPAPSAASDAATKAYVDSQSGGSLESDKTSSTSVVITSSNTARVLELEASGDVAVEFPADAVEAIPVGSWGLVYAAGAGQVTFSAGVGATVLAPNGAAKSAARYATIMWRKVAADTFALSGGLVP